MIKTNKIIKLLIASILLLGLFGSAYSVTGLNAILQSQNPDPVSPGNFVYVNVKVSNTGTEATVPVSISVLENGIFRVAEGESRTKNLGPIAAFSRGVIGDEEGFDIAKFKIFVSEKAPVGYNTLEIELKEGAKSFTYDFDILVQDSNPRIQINSFDISRAEPGKTSKLTMEIENINTVTLKDVFITLDLGSVTGEVISVLKGSNQKVISTLAPSETRTVSFDLVVDPAADAKPYLLPVMMDFEDSLDNSYSTEVIGSVEVYSNPYLSVQLDSQDRFTKGNTQISIAVANPGTSSIKGTRIEVLDSDEYEIIDGKFQYIGDLNPDDFQTLQSTVYVNSNEQTNVQVKVTYLDSYNQPKEEIIEIPLSVFSQDELSKYGLSSDSEGGFGFMTLILILLVGGAAYWYGGKRALKKKAKK